MVGSCRLPLIALGRVETSGAFPFFGSNRLFGILPQNNTWRCQRILIGGKRENTVFEPTVIENVPSSAILDKEEIFGPVVSLYKVFSLDEAIAKANDVEYGLHAAIFTNKMNDAFKAIKELDAGTVLVNDSTDYRIDQTPLGGVKFSGLGRVGIRHAIMDMTEPKVVCLNL